MTIYGFEYPNIQNHINSHIVTGQNDYENFHMSSS